METATNVRCRDGQVVDMGIINGQCIGTNGQGGAVGTRDGQYINDEGIVEQGMDNQAAKIEKVDVRDRDIGVKCTQNRIKIAMLLAYCGGGFQGMQKNPGAITIEGELEKALIRSGAMPHNYGDNPRRVNWARAARTDKGVSAVGQVVSGLFFVDPLGFVERVNSYLPKKIRLLGYKTVSPSFSAKGFCDRRRYEYVIPSFALDPKSHQVRETVVGSEVKEELCVKCMECCERSGKVSRASAKAWGSDAMASISVQECSMHSSAGNIEEPQGLVRGKRVSAFSFGECERKRLNHILSRYIGTHNFHNFTSRIRPDDPNATRCIISFEAQTPINVQDVDLVRCVVVGQSFMLHQIRKMIGLAIAIFRGAVPESIIDMALGRDVNVTIPTAPELGLFLDECMYPTYNEKWYGIHEEVSQEGYEKEINVFKREILYEYIVEMENKEGQMALFLHSLNDRNYAVFASAREAQKNN